MADAQPVRLCRSARLRQVSWGEALSGVLLPKFTWSADYFTTIVAILGTTISPYLFFWQASQEAEDSASMPRKRPLIEKHYGARANSPASAPTPWSAWPSPT